ncbi:MAG TPA: TetR/AcrR family transcriptional regulator [Burkholderiales bacterium]
MEEIISVQPIRQRLTADQRRDEIVRVTIDLGGRRSPESITTLDIARALDLTQGAIFRHFPTKESIWVAVIKWAGTHLMTATAEAVPAGSGPLEALERMFYAHVTFVSRHPAIPRLLFQQLQHSDLSPLTPLIAQLIDTYRTRLAKILLQGKQSGLVCADVNEEDAAMLFIGMVQGLAIQSSLFPRTASARDMLPAARRVFPIYLRGILSHRTQRGMPTPMPT